MPRFRFGARFWLNSNRQRSSNDTNTTEQSTTSSAAVIVTQDSVEENSDTRTVSTSTSTEPPSSVNPPPIPLYSRRSSIGSFFEAALINSRSVTVLLRESDGSAVYSRLLGRNTQPHLVHQPRQYHFIWSSDGSDHNLWSSPIRLRSYLSQFCTAVSRRVIPHGASIEVIIYPELTAATPPEFTPMSITRLYCMIHPLHPPTTWQSHFPSDFAGAWSSMSADLGINALSGPLLDNPIPMSLPDTLHRPPAPLSTAERPSSTTSDVNSIVPRYNEYAASPPLVSSTTASSTGLTGSTIDSSSSLSEDVESQIADDVNDVSDTGNDASDLPAHSSTTDNDSTITESNYQFPPLPNRGNHDFNLFIPPSYVMGPLLGEGEFAKVRMACNLATNGAVAIKIYRRRSGNRHSSIDEHILREMEVLKGIRCRNIVKIFETLVHGDRVFMIMEIMPKGDLRKYVNKVGALREPNARKMFADILNGVSYLHERSIVHLDLKLENLLLNQDLMVKITDFGCARLQIGRKRFNIPCGSYAYGAPEVISGRTYNGITADIWSIGIILYCMVSARLPYADNGQLPDLMWERHCPPEMPNWISSECKDLIHHILKYRPEQRLKERDIMSHLWMRLETRRLPWLKPLKTNN